MMKHIYLMLVPLLLTACMGSGLEDLEEFVRDSGKELRGNIPPAPEVKPPETFAYTNDGVPPLPNPFQIRNKDKKDNSADQDRPKQELEGFPLENLKMVGYLEQGAIQEGIIRSPDNRVFRVRVGNYIGMKFGKITAISSSGITISEIVQENGEDVARISTLQLEEQGVAK